LNKNKTIPDLIWQFFCSVKLTIYTLVLLAVTSIFGTVILQQGESHQYLNTYGEGWYNVIRIFNLDDMYHAWWFLALIVILCVNIVVCSIERLSTTWKIIFPKKIQFNADRFRKLKNRQSFTMQTDFLTLAQDCEKLMTKRIGKVIRQQTENAVVMYAEKGRWTRLGVYIVHSSILLLLMGALIGSLYGFKGFLNLDEGQTADAAFIQKQRSTVNLGFSIRCDDFDVKFYDTGTPAEYRSTLTIIEDGKESFTTDIRVNHPLRYKGINIFQSSYGQSRSSQPDTATFSILNKNNNESKDYVLKIGQEIQLPDDMGIFRLDAFEFHYDFMGRDLEQAFVGTLTHKNGKIEKIGLPLRFPSFDRMRKGDTVFTVKEMDQKYYTGLQITKDPGVWYVYAGFILMILGCWITFFMSHQSYLIEITQTRDTESDISISGTTNRGSHGMNLNIHSIANKIKGK